MVSPALIVGAEIVPVAVTLPAVTLVVTFTLSTSKSFANPTVRVSPSTLVIMFLPASNLLQSVLVVAPLTFTLVPSAASWLPSLPTKVKPSSMVATSRLISLPAESLRGLPSLSFGT